ASIWCPTAPISPIAAISERRASPISAPWITSAAVTCWQTSLRSSDRSILCSERWIADDYATPCRRVGAAGELCFYCRKPGMGRKAHCALSGGPPAICRDPAADACAGSGRMGFARDDRKNRRNAGYALYPRARSGHLLYAVPTPAGGQVRPYPGLRHHALYAAWRRRADRGL